MIVEVLFGSLRGYGLGGASLGGLVFLILPSEIGFPEHTDAGIWQPLYDFIYAVDARGNAAPSFHVIYTSTILLALMDVATPRLRLAFLLWLVLVYATPNPLQTSPRSRQER